MRLQFIVPSTGKIDHNSLYMHTYISSAFMASKTYLMKINGIWYLEAGEII